MTENRSRLYGALIRLLSPLVRILLRRGVSYTEFSDLAKRVFVHVADSDFAIEGRKQSASRVAIITGITRKDVARLRNESLYLSPDTGKHNRAARVVGGWIRDSAFHDDEGQPRPLCTQGDNSGFARLIKKYSGDMPVRAVLDELLRVGAVARTKDGKKVRLVKSGYVPRSDEGMLDLFGQSACDLLDTLDHNLSHPPNESRLQLSAVSEGMSREQVLRIKRLSEKKAMELLREIDLHLSAEEKAPTSPPARAPHCYRTGLGIYFIQQALSEPPDDTP